MIFAFIYVWIASLLSSYCISYIARSSWNIKEDYTPNMLELTNNLYSKLLIIQSIIISIALIFISQLDLGESFYLLLSISCIIFVMAITFPLYFLVILIQAKAVSFLYNIKFGKAIVSIIIINFFIFFILNFIFQMIYSLYNIFSYTYSQNPA